MDGSQAPARPFRAHMDQDQAIAATQEAMAGGSKILDMMDEPQESLGPGLFDAAVHLGEALAAVIDWWPHPHTEALELRAALEHFLS